MLTFSETSEFHRKEYQEKLECREKELERLKKELYDKNVTIEQLKVTVQELKLVIQRNNDDLEKMKKIESENCNLRAGTESYMNQIWNLQTLLKQETEKNETSGFHNIDQIIEIVEQRINSESNKQDEEYFEKFKQEFDKLRQNYISKTEFEQKLKDSEYKFNKLKTLYDKLIEEKQGLKNGNEELKCQAKQLEDDKRKLEREIGHVMEESRQLKISLLDIQKICNQQTVDIQRLTNEVELNKKTCKDCVHLREEIDKYCLLLNSIGNWSLDGSLSGNGNAADSSFSGCEGERKEASNGSMAQGYNFDAKSKSEASKYETKSETKVERRVRRVRQEVTQEAVTKVKKN